MLSKAGRRYKCKHSLQSSHHRTEQKSRKIRCCSKVVEEDAGKDGEIGYSSLKVPTVQGINTNG